MKYLVTGGAGFIGSNLVDCLIQQGHQVTVVDNESSDAHDSFYWRDDTSNHKIDICDYDSMRPLFDSIDVVFHLAAEARIQPALLNPILASKTNVVGTCTVLQCAREAGVKRVIYSSTSSAYGLKNIPPLRETMPNDCLNPYSVTKTSGEELCKMYTNLFELETVVFRYFNVYGERQPLRGQYAPVIGLFMRQKLEGKEMTVVGDGLQRRDFTHVSDVVNANILASDLLNKKCVGETFNIGTGTNHNILDIVRMVNGPYRHIPPRPAESRVTLSDSSKARLFLNWSSKVQLENWMKENVK